MKSDVAVLPRAEELSGAAQAQVRLGDFKAVVRAHHGGQALAGFVAHLPRGHQDAEGAVRAASHAPAQLMELRQAEALGVLDDHHRGVGHVHAYFNYGRGDQHLRFAAAEALDHRFLLLTLQAAVEQPGAQLRKHGFREALVFRHRGLQFRLRFFNHRIDHVRLPAFFHFAAQELPHAGQAVFGGDARLDRPASRRQLIDYGLVQVAIERERERARDGRGRHHQNVRLGAFLDQPFALQDAEAVLLVHNHQAQVAELRGLFNQRVRAHHELRGAGAQALERLALFRGLHPADQQPNVVAGAREQPPRRQVMLHGKDFRGRHQRHLAAVFHHDHRGLERHQRFPAAHVAHQQAVHGHGAFEVPGDFREHALLRRGGLEGQNFLYRFADARLAHGKGMAALLLRFAPAHGQAKLVVEQLLENQPALRGCAEGVQRVQVGVRGREVRHLDGRAPRGELKARADGLRQRIEDIVLEQAQRVMDDAPQHPRADAAQAFVDGHDAADFGRVFFTAAEQLILRIDHFHFAGAVSVEIRFAVQHDGLAGLEAAFEILAVEEAAVERAAGVLYGEVVDAAAPAAESSQAAVDHFAAHGHHAPAGNVSNRREVHAVFVTEGQAAQQVFQRDDAVLGQCRGARRSHAFEVHHLAGEVHGSGLGLQSGPRFVRR